MGPVYDGDVSQVRIKIEAESELFIKINVKTAIYPDKAI